MRGPAPAVLPAPGALAKFVSCAGGQARYLRHMRATIRTILATVALATPGIAQEAAFAPAVAAMQDRDWDMAYALAMPAGPVARSLVTWERLRDGAGAFPDYVTFLAAHPDWPGLDLLRREGERAIPPGHDPLSVLAFFADDAPQTGEGAVRLAEALTALDRAADAEAVLIETWLTLGLDDDGFAAMLADHGDTLAPYHAARVDAMLWRWRTTDAERLLPFLEDADRLLAEARIALLRRDGDADDRVAAVPDALAENPGLAHDRFDRMANAGDYTDAIALLKDRSGGPGTLGEPWRWASWRASLARWTMREGRPQEAYEIATAHHMTPGGDGVDLYADLEWLAGYVALRGLDDPATALAHFTAMEAAVSGPISTSRAAYWIGRAQEAAGDDPVAAYARAAEYQTAFYGLVAADRIDAPLDPALAGVADLPDWRDADWRTGDLGQALDLLLDAGDLGAAVQFTAALARDLDATGVAQLGTMLAERDQPFLTVLVGKTAAARGIVVPSIYFPLHPLAETELPVPPELALAIARRESEFNFTVGSPVGALGLMQLMPATAQEVSRNLGLPFSRARLTSEWEYNAVLGSAYLAALTATFGDSPVMIAAGYNAGPSRPLQWVAERGDPRRGEADVIDWIEAIPFTETRNYVMRVTESIPIYRARLTGQTGEVDFLSLLNGRPPLVRPVARP